MPARLSPIEAIMWRAGQDPTRRLGVGALLLLDQPPKEAELIERVGAAMVQAPRLRWRPDDPTFTRVRPAWVEDESAQPEPHVRAVEVAAPGSVRQVLDVVSLLDAVPFDPDRSPWDVTVLIGLERGRAALFVRAHHVLTDGIGGVRLLNDLFDGPGTDAPEPKLAAVPVRELEDTEDDDLRQFGTITIDLTRLVRPLSARVTTAREARPLDIAARGFQQALDLANSVSRQVLVTGGALSPAPPASSMISHFDVLSVSGASKAAIALGGSRNDLLVVASAAALGLYFERSGQRCPTVRVALPTRQYRGRDLDGNWFVPTRVVVPTSADHPARRFGVVVERLAQARHEPALRYAATLASTISRLPNRMLLPALNTQASSVDLAVSTVPGLRGTPKICGSTVEAAYPMGPRLGTPLNVTAFGSGGALDIGIALDPAAISNADAFRECLLESFGRLAPASVLT